MGKRLVGAPAAVTCCCTVLLYRFCCNHHWFVQGPYVSLPVCCGHQVFCLLQHGSALLPPIRLSCSALFSALSILLVIVSCCAAQAGPLVLVLSKSLPCAACNVMSCCYYSFSAAHTLYQ